MNKFKVWIEKQGGAHKVARLIDVTDSAHNHPVVSIHVPKVIVEEEVEAVEEAEEVIEAADEAAADEPKEEDAE